MMKLAEPRWLCLMLNIPRHPGRNCPFRHAFNAAAAAASIYNLSSIGRWKVSARSRLEVVISTAKAAQAYVLPTRTTYAAAPPKAWLVFGSSQLRSSQQSDRIAIRAVWALANGVARIAHHFADVSVAHQQIAYPHTSLRKPPSRYNWHCFSNVFFSIGPADAKLRSCISVPPP
ncbi:uncharacterized protein K452DRAFT_110573 [Aplosporella prunicola CBS 121167]|uniref:Uncharacterized protein n=1 Tax=Aplosporella prunicola CBS 121167 TaxID=1176127 RepID=A0A6A6B2F4_9PEZI|nr:uncharacterized protein K452DRAFT_110573 [Aplosporella prunicola CBS 121167]KAF2137394.1 hypothetical protein K452DRAFT_110573 [Aplosporella prunicola CBS 121167]